jgi:hypothetical protein
MFGSLRVLRVLAPLAVVCGALFAVSCGGNSTLTTATSYPTSASDVVTLSTSPGLIPLPGVSPGNSVSINYLGSGASPLPSPFPSAGITMTTTELTAPPTNAPALSSKTRSILSKSNAVVVTTVEFVLNYALPLSAFNMETLNLAKSEPVNQPYFVELDDLSATTGTTYINTFPGSAVSSGAVQFTNAGGYLPVNNVPGGGSGPVMLNTTDTYLLQFYYLSNGSLATPTPSPSPVSTASGATPYPTPTAVAVSTSIPLGAATTVPLPVVAGGFVATVSLPAGSGSTVSITGSSSLPNAITSVGTNDFPYYVLGFTGSSTAALESPGFSLSLPLNFSDSTSEIFAALCTTAACPISSAAADAAVPPSSITTGSSGQTIITYNPNSFKDFTSVSPTTQYLIVYSSRGTPASQSTSVPIAAGSSASIAIPAITTNQVGVVGGTYTGTLNLGGLGGATTATVAAQTGLFPSITAIVPNTQQIFYALSINASPQVSAPASLCGSAGCSAGSLTIPSSLATALTSSQNFYVEECSTSACPVLNNTTPYSAVLTLSGTTLTIPSSFVTNVTTLVPANSTNPAGTVYLVFYYQ